MVGAVGAYDWNGAVLKETRQGKVVPPKWSYAQEFPEELKNHGAYLGKYCDILRNFKKVEKSGHVGPKWLKTKKRIAGKKNAIFNQRAFEPFSLISPYVLLQHFLVVCDAPVEQHWLF